MADEKCMARSFVIYIPHQTPWSDQTKKNRKSRECGVYRGEGKCVQDFGGNIPRKKPT